MVLFQLGIFFLQTLAFQTRQTSQAHVQNGLRLLVGQGEALHELHLRLRRVRAVADDADDLVDVIQRDEQAFQNMGARLGLIEVVARAAHDHVLLVFQIVVEHLVQRKHLRLAIHQRQHDRAESFLHLRVLVQVVEHDGGIYVAL